MNGVGMDGGTVESDVGAGRSGLRRRCASWAVISLEEFSESAMAGRVGDDWPRLSEEVTAEACAKPSVCESV